MGINLILLLLSLFSSAALGAESVNFRTGIGFTAAKKSAFYCIGYEQSLVGNAFWRADIGTWTDVEPEHRGSPFVSALVGYRLGTLSGLNLSIGYGAVVAGAPDILIGGPLVFTVEAFLGYKKIGFGVKHFSNGGLFPPNLGRDYLILNVTFPMDF